MVFMKGMNTETEEEESKMAFMKEMNAEIGEGREQNGVHERNERRNWRGKRAKWCS
ncbi:hypothetical protein [Niallia sp. FSL M8-0099]|uniref:hypothetical protein n=1 Tax=Niallia sp. FSL M8-0099 TaxID=2954519 RepID=UPI0030F6F3D7